MSGRVLTSSLVLVLSILECHVARRAEVRKGGLVKFPTAKLISARFLHGFWLLRVMVVTINLRVLRREILMFVKMKLSLELSDLQHARVIARGLYSSGIASTGKRWRWRGTSP